MKAQEARRLTHESLKLRDAATADYVAKQLPAEIASVLAVVKAQASMGNFSARVNLPGVDTQSNVSRAQAQAQLEAGLRKYLDDAGFAVSDFVVHNYPISDCRFATHQLLIEWK